MTLNGNFRIKFMNDNLWMIINDEFWKIVNGEETEGFDTIEILLKKMTWNKKLYQNEITHHRYQD